MAIVGIISDTHKLLRPQALQALQGVDLIVHAGDIGAATVIEALEEIAPLFAIRGNIDKGAWAQDFPSDQIVEVEGKRLYVLHNLKEMSLDAGQAGFDVVVSGHSHKPGIERRAGTLYINPGSAGPRRFSLPVTLARLEITIDELRPQIIQLAV